MENVPGPSWANSSLFSYQILIKYEWKLVRGAKNQKRVGVAACENLEKVDQCGGGEHISIPSFMF